MISLSRTRMPARPLFEERIQDRLNPVTAIQIVSPLLRNLVVAPVGPGDLPAHGTCHIGVIDLIALSSAYRKLVASWNAHKAASRLCTT